MLYVTLTACYAPSILQLWLPADKETTAMPPILFRLFDWCHEAAWKAFVAVPLTIVGPVLDRATREDGNG